MAYNSLLDAAKELAKNPSTTLFSYLRSFNGTAELTADELLETQWINQAGTICDLNAYLLMCMATSVTRVEAMKAGCKVIMDQFKDGSWKSADTNDSAWVFSQKQAKDFRTLISNWAKLDGYGVLQLKFTPDRSPHTLVVERFPTKIYNNDVKRFRVYQGYEGVYRLSDHMEIAADTCEYVYGAENYNADPTDTGKIWKDTNQYIYLGDHDVGTNAYKKLFAKHKASLQAQYFNILQMISSLGASGWPLDWPALESLLIDPLAKMLGSCIKAEEYALFSGAPTKGQEKSERRTTWMLVLMSNTVTPSEFMSYDEVKALKNSMTGYVECKLYDKETE